MKQNPLSSALLTLGQTAMRLVTRNLGTSILLVIASACLLATQDALVKSMVTDIPMVQLLWLRFAIQTALTVAVLRAAGQTGLLKTRMPGVQVVRTIAILATGLLMFSAFKYLSLATSVVILFLNPVLVALFSTLFLSETIGPRRYMAIFLGFAGVVVVVDPSFDSFDPAMLLPLGAAVCAAIYVMLTRTLARGDGTLPALVLGPVLISLGLAPIQLWVWEPLSSGQWAVILGLAGIGTLGHTLLQIGLRGGSAAALSPYLYVQVAFSAFLGVIWFDEPLGLRLLIGGGMIVGSGLAIWAFQRYPSRAACKAR